MAKLRMPSGLAIRLRNKMRSSGTPRSFNTCTAMVAEPPEKMLDFSSVIRSRIANKFPRCLEAPLLVPRHDGGEALDTENAGKALLTCGEHWIEQQNPSIRDVLWKFVVEKLRLRSILVTLY